MGESYVGDGHIESEPEEAQTVPGPMPLEGAVRAHLNHQHGSHMDQVHGVAAELASYLSRPRVPASSTGANTAASSAAWGQLRHWFGR